MTNPTSTATSIYRGPAAAPRGRGQPRFVRPLVGWLRERGRRRPVASPPGIGVVYVWLVYGFTLVAAPFMRKAQARWNLGPTGAMAVCFVLAFVGDLIAMGAKVQAYDPTVAPGREVGIAGITTSGDAYAACEGATVVAVLTEWDDFRWLDFDKVRGSMAEANVVDARNLLDPNALRRRGFTYEGIGR